MGDLSGPVAGGTTASFARALTEVVSKAGVPYGYTLTIWAAGALSIGRFGLPSPGEVFLFVAGGTLGYVGLTFAATGGHRVQALRPPAALRENAFAAPAIGIAYAIGRLVDSARWAFFLLPLVATLAYLLGLAALFSWVARSELERAAITHTPSSSTSS